MEHFNNNQFNLLNYPCCNAVTKTKHFMYLLHIEFNRLNVLEHDCNTALDIFYALRQDIDTLHYNFLYMKLPDSQTEDHSMIFKNINEFSEFVTLLWQKGSQQLVKNVHSIQYASLIEKPLKIVTTVIIEHVEETKCILHQTLCHPECVTELNTMCSEIKNELIPCLHHADACLRQYVYLIKSIPFLKQLKDIITLFINRPLNYTVQSIYKELILEIPFTSNIINLKDCDDMKPFRYVIQLLNGQLLNLDPLDHRSEIKPVVSTNHLELNSIVISAVKWILQKNKLDSKSSGVQSYIEQIERSNRFDQCIIDYYESGPIKTFDSSTDPSCILHYKDSDQDQSLDHYENINSDQVNYEIGKQNHKSG
uniref:Uncharacterized protein n=4 Tax=Clastoptera arizonana TaxID=38151 RepID=A0A1B6E6Y6_9HEMI